MIGRVISNKLKNTATVLVEKIAKHPLYGKTFVQSKKYQVDDRVGVALGDIVEIVNSKPVSKNKHWRIIKVLGKNLAEITEQKLKEEAEKVVAEVMPAEEVTRVKSQESSEKKIEKVEEKKGDKKS